MAIDYATTSTIYRAVQVMNVYHLLVNETERVSRGPPTPQEPSSFVCFVLETEVWHGNAGDTPGGIPAFLQVYVTSHQATVGARSPALGNRWVFSCVQI